LLSLLKGNAIGPLLQDERVPFVRNFACFHGFLFLQDKGK
jgi:hypothetical protein